MSIIDFLPLVLVTAICGATGQGLCWLNSGPKVIPQQNEYACSSENHQDDCPANGFPTSCTLFAVKKTQP